MGVVDTTERRFDVRSQCWGKERYTKKEAIARAKKHSSMSQQRLGAYKCPWCSQLKETWHIGHRLGER